MLVRSLRTGFVTALAVIALDRVSKVWLLGVMAEANGGPIEVLPFFNLVMVWNYGVSFGVLNDGDTSLRWILVAVALGIVAALAVWLGRTRERHLTVAIGAVIGGALGNVIDRAYFGAVADFFDLHAAGWHWPSFNGSDIAITLGVGTLLLDALLRPRRGRT